MRLSRWKQSNGLETNSLAAENITHRFVDVVALNGVSLTLFGGECVALVGESGSGKTTLLRCFNRMVEQDEGTITVLGEDGGTVDPVLLRRRIGYVPQEGGLLPHWSVARNAATVPWLLGAADPGEAGARALAEVGLDPTEFGPRFPAELSGGQRQRVAIARAIASRPTAILMDEPFGALDAITRTELHQVFGELRQRLSMTTLLVTHDLPEAFVLADRIAVMRSGLIEQIGTPGELLTAPATDYVRLLLKRSRVSP